MLFSDADETETGYLKVGFYGGPGSGKTYTALKIATAIGKTYLIDTELGSEAYKRLFKCPDGSSFKVLHTRNLEEAMAGINEAVKAGGEVLVVDQVTTLWEMAQEGYIAKEHDKMSTTWEAIERSGNVPWTAWRHIKKPYKKFMRELINAPIHVFFAARMSVEYKRGAAGEPEKIGEKMNAEKDTPYEPQIVVKMEFNKLKKQWLAWVEKDRWGTIGGKVFVNPDVSMFADILPLMGHVHKQIPQDVEDIASGTVDEVLANSAQLRLLKMLMKKGGIDEIETRLVGITSVVANEFINSMTLSDYSMFTKKEG